MHSNAVFASSAFIRHKLFFKLSPNRADVRIILRHADIDSRFCFSFFLPGYPQPHHPVEGPTVPPVAVATIGARSITAAASSAIHTATVTVSGGREIWCETPTQLVVRRRRATNPPPMTTRSLPRVQPRRHW